LNHRIRMKHKSISHSASGFLTSILLFGWMIGLASPASGQFVALARKIKSGMTEKSNVATVTIDARASKVFTAVIDTVTSKPGFTITKKDSVRRLVEFSHDMISVALKIDSLDRAVSRITVTASESGKPSQKSADEAVNSILAVGHKLKIQCSVEK
jgi:hypothetical protein